MIEALSQLYTAVVADVLDASGYRRQALSSGIRALTGARKVCGRVFTARAEPVAAIPSEPYRLEMEAIDTMVAGDVLVIDAGHHCECAFWGELLSTACLAKGVAGVVMSACCRDLWWLEQSVFPVFGIGCCPADSKGRIDVVEIGQRITIDGVDAANGDWVLGDLDGVVIIPAEAVEETLRLAREKISGEDTVREELAGGAPVSEVFRKHGVL